jgi:hypothetical protein
MPKLRSDILAFLSETDLSTFLKADATELYGALFGVFAKTHTNVSFAQFVLALESLGVVPTPATYTLKRKARSETRFVTKRQKAK